MALSLLSVFAQPRSDTSIRSWGLQSLANGRNMGITADSLGRGLDRQVFHCDRSFMISKLPLRMPLSADRIGHARAIQ